MVGGAYLNRDFSARGEVRLVGSTIDGNLNLTGATVDHPGATAVNAGGAQVRGSAYFDKGFRAAGEMRLPGATIGGLLSFDAATLENPGAVALNADTATIAGRVSLSAGFEATGEVRLQTATVHGNLDCHGAQLSNPGGDALDADGAQIGGAAYFDQGFRAEGRLSMLGARFGNLNCKGGTFEAPGHAALALDGATVAGTIFFHGGMRTVGRVSLLNASATGLRDDRASWPQEMELDGFRYEKLYCPPEDRGWKARSDWLRRQRTPSTQGYTQLAAVYRAAGDDHDARKLLIERHNALLDPPEHWRSQLPAGARGWVGRGWRWVLRATIGHGFEPARALVIALPLLVFMALWYSHARDHDLMVAADEAKDPSATAQAQASDCDESYPCFQPVVYAVDNLVPIVDLGQRTNWQPDQSQEAERWVDSGRWLAAATWVTSAAGWLLATLVAASFTQVIRRE